MNESLLAAAMQQRILILDGAMGTMLQKASLSAEDFGGPEYEGCNERLNSNRPELIQEIHEIYLEAGADIIETNTFGATQVVLADYGLEADDWELNAAGARLARKAADRYATEERPRFVAGSMGPTNKMLTLTGGITFNEMAEAYYRQAKALIAGGVDLLLVETAQDTLNVKAAGVGIRRASAELGLKEEMPLLISGTIEAGGTTLAGQNVEAFYISLAHLRPLAIGINCATGPEFMRDHIRTLAQIAACGVSCYPNAGLPDEEGRYLEPPEHFAAKIENFANEGWLNIAGGCCGTTPEHIRALAQRLKGKPPRGMARQERAAISGIETVWIEEESRPILVGERTNVIGSRKFRDLISAGEFEEGSEIARAQVKNGAQVIDVCLSNSEWDEAHIMDSFLPYVVRKVKAPIMLDSTDLKVLETGLRYTQGKSVINSVNLEDGKKRLEEMAALLKRYGAALVVGAIDETGMGLTCERKLEIVRRSYAIFRENEVEPGDLIFDPLTFPVGTGDEQYLGGAAETIEAIRRIKREFPGVKTILGISNISFGLVAAGREVLNSVFLYHATKAGLDYAIVNAEKLVRYASIPAEERLYSEKILFETSEATVAAFVDFYRDKKAVKKEETARKTLEERLSAYVVEGSRSGLQEDLALALERYRPLEIINDVLMKGMEEVGRLFNSNQLIVAEVLKSAEIMKAAVTFLEPYLDKTESMSKGKIVIATVKGDVHDIGKNLLEVILANNSFQVVDLGIKVPPEQIIEACRREKPDAIGLSGLLVKSAHQMVTTAQDLSKAGIRVPLLVGGAALTAKFTESKIAPDYEGPVYYARDVMQGLDWMNRITASAAAEAVAEDRRQLQSETGPGRTPLKTATADSGDTASAAPGRKAVELQGSPRVPADLERHVLSPAPLRELWPYLNLKTLLGKHLGVAGDVEQRLAAKDPKTLEILDQVRQVFALAEQGQLLQARGVFQFFPALAAGEDMLILEPESAAGKSGSGRVLERVTFPRQKKAPGLCLTDYLHSAALQEGASPEADYVGLMVLTAGIGVRAAAEELKNRGEYLRSHILQALALELAEAFVEKIHETMRELWGFPDPVDFSMKERLAGRYQGIRVSLGYPACPNLEDQAKLMRLLRAEELGITLTDGFMLEPEASVSAFVFSHPQAKYFVV
ncbi:MAG: methionine synthase [Peptococcaceae bacterium]|nr:methionine synthase [Peptococcaceae bacterium]